MLRLLSLPLLSFFLAFPAAAEGPQGPDGQPQQQPAPPQQTAPIMVVEQSQLPGAQPVPAPPPPPTRHGLYFRAALGGGGMYDDFHGPLGLFSGHASGPSTAFELMVGWALSPRFVLGGGVSAEWIQNPIFEGIDSPGDVSVGILTMAGPFITWYLSAEPQGWFLSAFVGAARITIKDADNHERDHSPVGGAGSVALGYEFLLGDQLGLGAMARVTGGTLGDDGFTHQVGAFSLLAELSWY